MKVHVRPLEERMLQEAALLLREAFPHDDGYPTLGEAIQEASGFLGNNLSRAWAALTDTGEMAGWIGVIPAYKGKAWELHPLVVRRRFQRLGVATALVRHLEAEVSRMGGGTVFLGADDIQGKTSVGGTHLFPGVLEKLLKLRNPGHHPVGFYQAMGYEVTGIIPDANGPGKPDILMAKRVEALDPIENCSQGAPDPLSRLNPEG